jgi:hypothetical protein
MRRQSEPQADTTREAGGGGSGVLGYGSVRLVMFWFVLAYFSLFFL